MRGVMGAVLVGAIVAGVCGCGGQQEAEAPAGSTGVPQVVFVNVGEAVPAAVFEQALGMVRESMRVNLRGQALATIDPCELVRARGMPARKLGGKVCVAVFMVSDTQVADYLSQPGFWSLVNVHALRKDAPDAALYQRRVAKMLLKGLGHAAGVGSNPDPRCVMYYKSFTLAGLDGTSATYGPYAYFPLQDTLRAIAGDAVFETGGGGGGENGADNGPSRGNGADNGPSR